LKQLRGTIARGIQPDSYPETKLEVRMCFSLETATMVLDGWKTGSNPHERKAAMWFKSWTAPWPRILENGKLGRKAPKREVARSCLNCGRHRPTNKIPPFPLL
jgi:hypothetical protein